MKKQQNWKKLVTPLNILMRTRKHNVACNLVHIFNSPILFLSADFLLAFLV